MTNEPGATKTQVSQEADVSALAHTPAHTPMQMISEALSNGVDISMLEKLMELQQKWEESESRKHFATAMASFQSKLGPIIKKQTVAYGGTVFKFANIDDIAQEIRPLLSAAGLSYRFEQSQDKGSLTIKCIVTHVSGHSEQSQMTGPLDATGGKNAIQSVGSTCTYLSRYTLCAALGITSGDQDSDGAKQESPPARSGYDDDSFNELFLKWFELIASGKKSAMAIITQISNSKTLTADQLEKLFSLKDVEPIEGELEEQPAIQGG